MKNKLDKNRQSIDKKSSSKKGKKEHSAHHNSEISKNTKIKSPEKMVITVDETIQKELEEKEEAKKPKIKIFNNKKNNGICSDLLKSAINQEKELIMMPYAKEKEKINKTLNTIGNAHGISYPTCSVINGILTQDKNYLAIIREDDRKKNKKKKNKLLSNIRKEYIAEINLDNNIVDDNNLKEMLGNVGNTQNYI